MNTLSIYLKLFFLAAVSFLFGCTQQNKETTGSTTGKIIIALEPDKDPDAMLEDRSALEDYLSESASRSVEAIVPMVCCNLRRSAMERSILPPQRYGRG